MYRATQLDLDRQVALKVFHEGYLTRAGALERFRREAIAAGRLEHTHIVPVYDAGEVEGRAFISMRLVPGDTLAERIARGGALTRRTPSRSSRTSPRPSTSRTLRERCTAT